MTVIPGNLGRVPNALASHVMLGSLGRTASDLLDLQVKLTTQSRIVRPSDDPIGTSAVTVIEDGIERRSQRLRNLSHAESVLNTVDAALGDLSALIIEAKGIASSQIGVGSDEQTRANQALVIDAMLSESVNIANRKYQQMHVFAGETTARTPMISLGNGLRYQGQGAGLVTDLGLSRGLPITVSGEDAFGALSARVEGERDLDPRMAGDTRLVDLRGARGLGIALGSINVDVDGTDLVVDLSSAHTVQDVVDLLTEAIQTVNTDATVDIDPTTGNRLIVDPSGSSITFADLAVDATAADLGLDKTFTDADQLGADLDPRLTELTRLEDLAGVTVPMGTIRLENNGETRDLDLSGAETVQDLMNLVHGLDIGIRVVIAESGDRLNFVNEVSGGSMSIGEASGGAVATELGVRTFTGSTRLADFNEGRGVSIRAGSVDPTTGLPDPEADVDFRITLRDGTEIDVDLAGAETVQDVLDAINGAAADEGVDAADFAATLADDGNGIMLVDATNLGVGTISVERMNGSNAADDLGIAGSTDGATLTSEDRARVAVDSLFTHLIRLRDALRTNDERGITLAAERLESHLERVAGTRAEVGVRTRRVTDATVREEDLRTQDLGLRSQIKDLDFTEAAMRFSLLQQQLQAGLTAASRAVQQSLLDFLR